MAGTITDRIRFVEMGESRAGKTGTRDRSGRTFGIFLAGFIRAQLIMYAAEFDRVPMLWLWRNGVELALPQGLQQARTDGRDIDTPGFGPTARAILVEDLQ